MRKRPLVAIVGRPNVGKSTLFNRILGERRAVVHPLPGMTRDRHFADAEYAGRPFTIIDTGGYEDSTDSPLLQQMRQQSIIAIEEADTVLFITDVNEPDDPVDQDIVERLRSSGRRFFLVVNKCEGGMREAQAYADFSRYGLDRIYPVSALHGSGVYDMLDDLTEDFEQWDPDDEEHDSGIIRVAIVGRQNVGKSTLLNQLLGEERVIANPVGGTTRDAIDAELSVDGQPFLLIDTAGIRRRGRIERGPEKLSVHSSFRAIDRAHVALLVLDATDGVTMQDQHIAGYIMERRRACIILVNKWDQIPDREQAYGETIRNVRREFGFMSWAPIMTISALTGQRTHRIWDKVLHCTENFRKEFSTRELNLILLKATSYLSPPTFKGNTLTIKYVTQISTQPPTIALFVNDPRFVHFSYRRYLLNQFMQQLGLEGTPLILRLRRKAPPRGWERARQAVQKDSAFVDADEPAQRLLGQDETFQAGVYTQDGEKLGVEQSLDDAGAWDEQWEDMDDEDDDE